MPDRELLDGGNTAMDGGRRHRGSKKSRKSRKSTRKQSKWMQHVMATKRANKDKDLSEVLVIASKTYKKTGGGGSMVGVTPEQLGGNEDERVSYGGPAAAPGAKNPFTGRKTSGQGGRKTRKSKKSRGSRKH